MPKYRKKPVVIEAIRFDGKNGTEIMLWSDGSAALGAEGLHILTLEGEMRAGVGDYVIKGVQGEFYPCKPDIFEATYEVAD